ncbi:MAG: response regulator [Candidatus Eremiobacteraeota bacterium]|nr:response regulator [Candidatus Eremiobacteraeota bacterium]
MSIDCRPKILVVEDEALVAADLEDRLTDLGYHVCGHSDNYAGALEQAELYTPDLVLLDICLQGSQDGIQVAGELRQRSRTPFIFLTAYADAPTLMRASQMRPAGYVLKPLRTRDLDAAIQMALLQIRSRPLSTSLRGCRVLVLEADPGLRRLLGRVLLREGAQVSVEPDLRVNFDLVVGGDGTAPARATLRLTDFEDGRPHSLAKPFSLDTFLAKVKELLQLQH